MRRWASAAASAPWHSMDNTERVQRLWALYQQLDELIQPDEIEVYPVLEHLGDLIGDLELD